ncbi:MAG: hypothetical protein ACKVZH_02455 [Blastocatellia bacterium]
MTAQRKNQSGQPKARSGSRRQTASQSASNKSSRSKRQKNPEHSNKGARVIFMMVIVGGIIGSIFVLAQKFQISALHLKKTEESLKSEIDTLASQQRYLNYQREKALSTQESEKAAAEFNLLQPVAGRAVTQKAEPEAKPTPKAKEQAPTKTSKAASVALKQPKGQTQQGKLVKNAKAIPAKASKPGKPSKTVAATNKTDNSKKNGKQVAKAQASQKGARR